MRVLDINFQSLKSKREEFWSLLEQSEPDIVLGSETWLKPSIAESEVLPPTYKFAARRDRLGSPHGGVAIITKAIIRCIRDRFGRRHRNCRSFHTYQPVQTSYRV